MKYLKVPIFDNIPTKGYKDKGKQIVVQKLALDNPNFKVLSQLDVYEKKRCPLLVGHDTGYACVGNVFLDTFIVEEQNGVLVGKVDIEVFECTALYDTLCRYPNSVQCLSPTIDYNEVKKYYDNGQEVWHADSIFITEVSWVGKGNFTAHISQDMAEENSYDLNIPTLNIIHNAETGEDKITIQNNKYGIMDENKEKPDEVQNSDTGGTEKPTEAKTEIEVETKGEEPSVPPAQEQNAPSAPVVPQITPTLGTPNLTPEEMGILQLIKKSGIEISDVAFMAETAKGGKAHILSALQLLFKIPGMATPENILSLTKQLFSDGTPAVDAGATEQEEAPTGEIENSEEQTKQVIIQEQTDNEMDKIPETTSGTATGKVENNAIAGAGIKVIDRKLTPEDVAKIATSKEDRNSSETMQKLLHESGMHDKMNKITQKYGLTPEEAIRKTGTELEEYNFSERDLSEFTNALGARLISTIKDNIKKDSKARNVVQNSAIGNIGAGLNDPFVELVFKNGEVPIGNFKDALQIQTDVIEDYIHSAYLEPIAFSSFVYPDLNQVAETNQAFWHKHLKQSATGFTRRKVYRMAMMWADRIGANEVPSANLTEATFSQAFTTAKLGLAVNFQKEFMANDVFGIMTDTLGRTEKSFRRLEENEFRAIVSSDGLKYGSAIADNKTSDYLMPLLKRADALPEIFRYTTFLQDPTNKYVNRPTFLRQEHLTPGNPLYIQKYAEQNEVANWIVDANINFSTDPQNSAKKLLEILNKFYVSRQYPFVGEYFKEQPLYGFVPFGQKIKLFIPYQGYTALTTLTNELVGSNVDLAAKMLFANSSAVATVEQAKILHHLTAHLDIIPFDPHNYHQQYDGLHENNLFLYIPSVSFTDYDFNLPTFMNTKSSVNLDYETEHTDQTGGKSNYFYRYQGFHIINPNGFVKITTGQKFYEAMYPKKP